MPKAKDPHLPNSEVIKVFLRVKPNTAPDAVEYEIDEGGHFRGAKRSGKVHTIKFEAPDDFVERHSQIPSYKFAFDHIFDQPVEQTEVYEEVAKPVVEQALEGYNGTVFAYGQTATGKTHTILGPPHMNLEEILENMAEEKRKARRREAEKLKKAKLKIEVDPEEDEDADDTGDAELEALKTEEEVADSPEPDFDLPPSCGLILRTLDHVFSFLELQEGQRTVEISYLEIYNNEGFDLLSGKRGRDGIRHLKDLTKVVALTDARQKLHLKNLSLHLANTIEHATELLQIGNAARKVAETHMNEASSRSHCIFTIHVAYKRRADATIIRSKINLVDLSGSERVSKWGKVNKTLLKETRNINLSLHHLQRVIEALSHRQLATNTRLRNQHVPFRSSLITLVLSDSLGGNSVTRMVATVSDELPNLDETISTCRFAQRVASIHNKVISNQSADSDLLIARLKKEIAELRQNLEDTPDSQDGRTQTSPVEFDEEALEELVLKYLEATDKESVLDVGLQNDVVQFCYRRMKQQVWTERRDDTVSAVKKSKSCTIL